MNKIMIKKIKDIKKGVYTVTCNSCGQNTYVHIDDEGEFDPLRCRSCKVGFLTIFKGERNNEYRAETSGEKVPDEVVEEETKDLEEETVTEEETKDSGETKVYFNKKKGSRRKHRRN